MASEPAPQCPPVEQPIVVQRCLPPVCCPEAGSSSSSSMFVFFFGTDVLVVLVVQERCCRPPRLVYDQCCPPPVEKRVIIEKTTCPPPPAPPPQCRRLVKEVIRRVPQVQPPMVCAQHRQQVVEPCPPAVRQELVPVFATRQVLVQPPSLFSPSPIRSFLLLSRESCNRRESE